MAVKKCAQTFSLVNATGVAGLTLVVDFEEARWGMSLRDMSADDCRRKDKEISQGTLLPGGYIPFRLNGEWMEIGYNRVSLVHQQQLIEMAQYFFRKERYLPGLDAFKHLIDYQLERTEGSLVAGVIFDIKGFGRYRELVWTIPNIEETAWGFGEVILPPKPKFSPHGFSWN